MSPLENRNLASIRLPSDRDFTADPGWELFFFKQSLLCISVSHLEGATKRYKRSF
jgi:hypothetical protein